MFSPEIVGGEEFKTMPMSSQALYFHLGMDADDDGFVQPKLIMRAIGFTDDDLKVLLAKRFLLEFGNGVVVIKHWLIHNMIRADRYKPTRYLEEKKTLFIKENKAYTENKPLGLQSGNQMAPQVRLGKVNIPASQASKMKKNTMGKYREDAHSDFGEIVIDSDTGRPSESALPPNASKAMKELLSWYEARSGRKFVNIPKQYKAMALMRKAGIQPDDIKKRIIEMEMQDFYKTAGLDFMSVASSFDKK